MAAEGQGAPSALRRLEAEPATSEHRRAPANFAPCAATRQRVNTTVFAPARAAKDFSRGPCKRARNTCAWPRKLAPLTNAGGIVANFVASRSA